MAKNSLERYTHYYERWATNQLVSTGLALVFEEDKPLFEPLTAMLMLFTGLCFPWIFFFFFGGGEDQKF